MRRWVVIALAVVASGCGGATTVDAGAGRVVRVADGDTLTVRTGGEEVHVRLLGIDAPESSTTRFGRPDCGGGAAERSLRRLAHGARVRLITDPASGDTRDQYGRLLAYVDGPRGDLGEAQLRAGHAAIYRYRERRFSRLRRYRDAEASARAVRAGAWGACGGQFHAPGG